MREGRRHAHGRSAQEFVGRSQRLVQDGQTGRGIAVTHVERWCDVDAVTQNQREQLPAEACLDKRSHRRVGFAGGADRHDRLLGLSVANQLDGP
jgi:hypothetical protein